MDVSRRQFNKAVLGGGLLCGVGAAPRALAVVSTPAERLAEAVLREIKSHPEYHLALQPGASNFLCCLNTDDLKWRRFRFDHLGIRGHSPLKIFMMRCGNIPISVPFDVIMDAYHVVRRELMTLGVVLRAAGSAIPVGVELTPEEHVLRAVDELEMVGRDCRFLYDGTHMSSAAVRSISVDRRDHCRILFTCVSLHEGGAVGQLTWCPLLDTNRFDNTRDAYRVAKALSIRLSEFHESPCKFESS